MLTTRCVVSMLSVGLLVLATGRVCAQDYPNKPIRLVTGTTTSGTGIASRLIAQAISGPLAQQVIVDNRGGGVAPPEIVSKAPADGYTVIVSGSSFWLQQLTQKVSYDPVKDFAPITTVSRSPLILFVHPALPATSVKELIALAKSKPGQLNNSVGGVGGSAHLAGELFKSMAGVKIVAVPYSSGSQELTDLLGGQVQLTISTPSGMMEQVKLGKLRALAVTTAEPSALAPGLPTIAAAGVPGYEWETAAAMFAPAKTPAAIIKRLNQEVVRYVRTPEAKERFLSIGIEPANNSPEELAARIKSDITKVSKVIKDAGIRAD